MPEFDHEAVAESAFTIAALRSNLLGRPNLQRALDARRENSRERRAENDSEQARAERQVSTPRVWNFRHALTVMAKRRGEVSPALIRRELANKARATPSGARIVIETRRWLEVSLGKTHGS